jgi:hypothetical protein
MTDVHIKFNIISADYSVVPDTLIHLVLKGKILTVDGQSEPFLSTTLLRPSVHLSTVCELSSGSHSVVILNCHSSVYFANIITILNRFRIRGVAMCMQQSC